MTPRSLAEIEADLARLDAMLLPYGNFEDAPESLQGELARLSMERIRALNAQSAEGEERPQEAA